MPVEINDIKVAEAVDTQSHESQSGDEIIVSAEDEKRIRWRIDMCLVPVLMFSIMLHYLDKVSLSFTTIMGMPEDLHLVGSDYNWASSVYFFGYIIAQYPASALLVKLPLGKTLSLVILTWSIIVLLTPVSRNASGLIANRFFLGFAEAATFPGFMAVVSVWYKRDEQPLRNALWVGSSMVGGMFGSLIAYGIGHITTIQPWKAVFLILGLITFVWAGLLLLILLPNGPRFAWFLSKEDREKAYIRVKRDAISIKTSTIKWDQVREGVKDPLTWLLCLGAFASNVPNGGISNFTPIIVKGLGFDTFTTLLLSMITFGYAFTCLVLVCGVLIRIPNTRTIWLTLSYVVALVGVVLVQQLERSLRWPRFIAYCLVLTMAVTYPMTLAIMSANIGGFTKKMTVNAMILIFFALGNIIGPHLFFARESPTYPSGLLSMMINCAAGIVISIATRIYLIWQNRIRDARQQQLGEEEGIDAEPNNDSGDGDKTDWQMPHFRYVY